MPVINCSPEIPGEQPENSSSFTHVSYRRVIAVDGIEDGTVIRCRTSFVLLDWKDESALGTTPHPDEPVYDHGWTTPRIRIVPNITGSSFD